MEKRLNSKRGRLPDLFMEFLGSFGDFEDGLDSKEENKKLMFKKKFRFKSPSMDARSTPMGFSGLKNRSVSTRDGSDLNGLFEKTDAGSLKRDGRRKDGNVHFNSVQNEVNKWEKERGDLRNFMRQCNRIRRRLILIRSSPSELVTLHDNEKLPAELRNLHAHVKFLGGVEGLCMPLLLKANRRNLDPIIPRKAVKLDPIVLIKAIPWYVKLDNITRANANAFRALPSFNQMNLYD
ncbi:hypothetical protein D5086_019075 [Populus alba]|uniref:Uncharacterized protein n=1 Tax=Populus alba TaxID=43335 RepID=A0ACC4BGT5_POPAL